MPGRCSSGQPTVCPWWWPGPFRLKARAHDDLARLDKFIGHWLADEDGDSGEWDPLDPGNVLIDIDSSLAQWTLCQAFQWRHLPKPGGILAQDDVFLHDAAIISRRLGLLRAAKERNKKRREEAEKRLGILRKLTGKGK